MAEAGDLFRLDRAGVRASFDRASASYESAAGLQARVAAELLGRLDAFDLRPRVVLDLGAGTGRNSRELKRRFPRATVIALDLAPGMLREARRHQLLWRRFERVCGDAQRLPADVGEGQPGALEDQVVPAGVRLRVLEAVQDRGGRPDERPHCDAVHHDILDLERAARAEQPPQPADIRIPRGERIVRCAQFSPGLF